MTKVLCVICVSMCMSRDILLCCKSSTKTVMDDTDKGRNYVLYEEWVGILMLSFNNHRYRILLFCITSLYFWCCQTHQFNCCLHNAFLLFKHGMTTHSAATMKHTKRRAIFYIVQCLTWETGITLEAWALKSSYKNPVITDLTHQRSFR